MLQSLEQLAEYWGKTPTFHDDYLKKFELTEENDIIIIIETKINSFFHPKLFARKCKQVCTKLLFKNVKIIDCEYCDDEYNIIGNLSITSQNNVFLCTMEPVLGSYFKFKFESMEVLEINENF